MCQMLITINGKPQMSFEQFEKTFKQTFERDMTQDERRLFEPAFLKPDLKPRSRVARHDTSSNLAVPHDRLTA